MKAVKDSRPAANREEIEAVIVSLSKLFEIDLSSLDDFKSYNYYQYSFPELFSAGLYLKINMLDI